MSKLSNQIRTGLAATVVTAAALASPMAVAGCCGAKCKAVKAAKCAGCKAKCKAVCKAKCAAKCKAK